MSVIRVFRCGVTRGTLSGKHVLTLIWKIMTGGSLKIVLNWAVLTNAIGYMDRWLHIAALQEGAAACLPAAAASDP